MIEGTYKAILLGAKDYKENDKLLRLLTVEGGIINALMRGVKRPSAKLRFGAVPFAFCEYTLYRKDGFFIVTNCTQIEDIFAIATDYDSYAAGCIMLESAEYATGTGVSPETFILLLKSLKLILYSDINSYIVATAFIQKLIHEAGYAYEYAPPPKEITTMMDFLAFLDSIDLASAERNATDNINHELIKKTLIKLISNFENKFDCEIKSKKVLVRTDASR